MGAASDGPSDALRHGSMGMVWGGIDVRTLGVKEQAIRFGQDSIIRALLELRCRFEPFAVAAWGSGFASYICILHFWRLI